MMRARNSGFTTGANVMDITSLVVQLLSGAVGGNAAGAALKKLSLGTIGNTIVGILGGGLGGQILALLGLGGPADAGAAGAAGAPAGAGLDLNAILASVASGGVGGGALMAIVGFLRKQFAPGPK
jgi:hypothetical protein